MVVADLTKLLLLILVCTVLTGCAGFRDRRDAPWDPRGGVQLIDQIPAWDRVDQQCGDYTNGRVPRC